MPYYRKLCIISLVQFKCLILKFEILRLYSFNWEMKDIINHNIKKLYLWMFPQAYCVADLFKEERERHCSTEKHRPADYETETGGVAGIQVNNGTANRNCWRNELALRLLTATRPWLSSSCLWEAKKVSGFFSANIRSDRLVWIVHVGVAFSSSGLFFSARRILDFQEHFF